MDGLWWKILLTWMIWGYVLYPYFRKTPFTQFYSRSKQRQVSKNGRLVGHEVRQVGLVVLLTLKWGQNGRIWAEGWFLRHNCSKLFFLFLDRHGPTWLTSNPFRAMVQCCNTVPEEARHWSFRSWPRSGENSSLESRTFGATPFQDKAEFESLSTVDCSLKNHWFCSTAWAPDGSYWKWAKNMKNPNYFRVYIMVNIMIKPGHSWVHHFQTNPCVSCG